MAWRSSGSTNKELVDNLKRYGVITNDYIERGFRNVDRKFFVPKGNDDIAYADQPLKEGHVHVSAPHIYGSALEALELLPNSSLSFLNIGSGTGYLSCIVAEILGHQSLNYGVEIHQDVIDHSMDAIKEWRESKLTSNPSNAPLPQVNIIHGNALNVSSSGESIVGFDRIYIGASIDQNNLSKVTRLLSPGGILVGPVDDELVKIVRIGPLARDQKNSMVEDQDGNEGEGTDENNEFTRHVLSGVRFAPLISNTSMKETVIPARIWTPSLHQYFPDNFQKASMHLLLCSNSHYVQPRPPPIAPEERINLAALLPRVIWIEILSYTHRKWFESKESETEFLRKRLLEEQTNAKKAQQARAEAEARCHVAERERDVYRLLARRWQSRLQIILQQQRHMVESGVVSRSAASMRENGNGQVSRSSSRERISMFNLGILQQENEEDDEERETEFFFSSQNSMEEDDEESMSERETAMVVHESNQLMEFLVDEGSEDEEEYDFQSLQSENNDTSANDVISNEDDITPVPIDHSDSLFENHVVANPSFSVKDSSIRPGIRTVSMGSEDL